jgi:hypothetical protein
MQILINNKQITRALLSMGFVLMVSGCVSHQDFVSEQSGNYAECPGVEHDDDQCSAYKALAEYKREVHKEYYEQVLPIHERKEVIEQEIEDARDRKRNH